MKLPVLVILCRRSFDTLVGVVHLVVIMAKHRSFDIRLSRLRIKQDFLSNLMTSKLYSPTSYVFLCMLRIESSFKPRQHISRVEFHTILSRLRQLIDRALFSSYIIFPQPTNRTSNATTENNILCDNRNIKILIPINVQQQQTMTLSPTFEIESSLQKEERKNEKLSDSTVSLSSSDSSSDLSSRVDDSELNLHRSSPDDLNGSNAEQDDLPQRKKSVRFSQVHTREYNVVDELPSPLDDEGTAPRRTLGWDYSESQLDIDAHMLQVMVERKETYARLIHEHILRAEREREEKKKENEKKKGWKARVKRSLKPIGKSFMEAAMRSNYMLSAVPL